MSTTANTNERLAVRKTYKLYVGGKFPRSESGRSYEVTDGKGRFVANAAMASRKDARDAVAAAHKGFPSWSGATAHNRGQIVYRIAEMLEGRHAQFAGEVAAAEALAKGKSEAVVSAAIDRLVWYAGWSDKVAQIHGSTNPVAGPYHNYSEPEPTGIVAIVAPAGPEPGHSLLGLLSVLAPVVVTGNTAVILAAEDAPLPAMGLAEVLGTSDLPGGVVNILTGRTTEVAPWLASHMDVAGIDLCGAPADAVADLEEASADNLKRVVRPPEGSPDWFADPGVDRLLAFLETKTVWHPVGV